MKRQSITDKLVVKRKGKTEGFSTLKIYYSIINILEELGLAYNDDDIWEIVFSSLSRLNVFAKDKEIIDVEDIQNIVTQEIKLSNLKNTELIIDKYLEYSSHKKYIEQGKYDLLDKAYEITLPSQTDDKRENANVDADDPMGTMLLLGSYISKEIAQNYGISNETNEYIKRNLIHVHDMDFLPMDTTTCLHIPLGKLLKEGFNTGWGSLRTPQTIQSASSLAAIALQSNQNNQHGGQSFASFDFDMAPFVGRSFIKNIYLTLDVLGRELSEYKKELVNEILKKDESKVMEKEQVESLRIIVDLSNEQMDRIIKKTEEDTFQAMEALVFNLNTMNSRAGSQVPFSSINFGLDTSVQGRMISRNLLKAQNNGLGNGETAIFPILIFKVKEGINYNEEDPNYDLLLQSVDVSSRRMFPNYVFVDAPFNSKYFNPEKPEHAIATMGCRTRVLANVNGPAIPEGRGNLSFTSINLVNLALRNLVSYKKVTDNGLVNYIHFDNIVDIDGFYRDLEDTMFIVKEQLLTRLKSQGKRKVKNFEFLMGQGCWLGSEDLNPEDTLEEVLKQGTLTIGFIGLAETLKVLTGKHHGESKEAQELGLDIVSFMRELTDLWTEETGLNFSLIATPAESLSGKFIKQDKMLFGEIKGITDKDYYTNSFHVPVGFPITAFEKIEIEAPYHNLTNGGHITYIELDGDPSKNPEAYMSIIRKMKEEGIGYGAINFPMDHDPVCGYRGNIEGSICPKCGRDEDESDIKHQRIRRITGYLVGTLDRFNDAKKAEEQDRVKHDKL